MTLMGVSNVIKYQYCRLCVCVCVCAVCVTVWHVYVYACLCVCCVCVCVCVCVHMFVPVLVHIINEHVCTYMYVVYYNFKVKYFPQLS